MNIYFFKNIYYCNPISIFVIWVIVSYVYLPLGVNNLYKESE